MLNTLKMKTLLPIHRQFTETNKLELERVAEALTEGFTFGRDRDEYIIKKRQKDMKTNTKVRE